MSHPQHTKRAPDKRGQRSPGHIAADNFDARDVGSHPGTLDLTRASDHVLHPISRGSIGKRNHQHPVELERCDRSPVSGPGSAANVMHHPKPRPPPKHRLNKPVRVPLVEARDREG